jgi:hypothetical protein
MVKILAGISTLLLITACVGPLTKPEGVKCKQFLKLADEGTINPILKAVQNSGINKKSFNLGGKTEIRMLILSGGGKYGAYGAGFLQGWTASEIADPGGTDIKRDSFDIVTGISTGALLSTFAMAGNGVAADSEARQSADAEARKSYQTSDKTLFKLRSPLLSLRSNGLADISNGLQKKLDDIALRYLPKIAALPDGRALLIGLVNLTNGKFYVADLVEIAKAGDRDCYREIILASAAVPVQFPPRFIDGHPYVDGGVRFGAFLGQSFADSAKVAEFADAGYKVSFRAIINGNLSPNGIDHDVESKKSAISPSACDNSTLDNIDNLCGKFDKKYNRILWIAQRAAGDILVDQVYRDSIYRIYNDLSSTQLLGSHGFTYIPNQKIEEAKCKRATKDSFDVTFMNCLADIGEKTARQISAPRWLSFDAVPHIAKPQDK